MTSVRDKLDSELEVVTWPPLRLHAKRNALFLVAPRLDLLEVAVAIAENRTTEVEAWIAAGDLRRPTASELARYDAAPEAVSFHVSIVQPFVLAQPASLPT